MHVQMLTHLYENATFSSDLKINKYKEANTCLYVIFAGTASPRQRQIQLERCFPSLSLVFILF
jgi:hypothetical protein